MSSSQRRQRRRRRQISSDNNKRHDKPSNSTSLPLELAAPLGVGRRRDSAAPSSGLRSCSSRALLVALLLVATTAFEATLLLEAKSIEDSESSNGPTSKPKIPESLAQPTTTTTTSKPISLEALTDLIDRVTTEFTAANKVAETSTAASSPVGSTQASSEAPSSSSTAAATTATTTTTDQTTSTEATTNKDYEDDEQPAGARDDDHDAQDCQGLSGGSAAPGAGPSDNERLVRLQACLQKKVEAQLKGAARSSMEMFDRLALSGACTGSLFGLMSSLGQLKGFAFKFIDASAKVPSGMMSGLLSDFGDFEQCLAIRSNPQVDPRDEQELGGYSGKYCLLNIRLKYHVKLGPNSTVPEGIYPDGVLWDELVRNYWTSNSSKGFQVGVCVPSRCNQDDLEQMLRLTAESYHFEGQIGACQDSNDLRRQQEPDKLQVIILWIFVAFVLLNSLGTLLDLYWLESFESQNRLRSISLIACLDSFSIRRNWSIFLRGGRPGHRARSPAGISRNNSSSDHSDDLHRLQGGNTSTLASGSLTDFSSSSISCFAAASLMASTRPMLQPITIKILPDERRPPATVATPKHKLRRNKRASNLLRHLWGLKLLVIVWITVGHSFLYPSANNYQHYRSIVNMNITRTSVWFATTNFILGIDMLLYMTGLLFVHKLVDRDHRDDGAGQQSAADRLGGPARIEARIGRLLAQKVLRFLPVYVAVIALAIVAPLLSNGPMWPEMVAHRLGETCRSNWWANLLMVNNLLASSSRVCLPSSWFISVVAQCFLVGSLVMLLASRHSMRAAAGLALLLICTSSSIVFAMAYMSNLSAPAIRMDESFVMELDDNIFQMYTSPLSNLGPFLIGMLGGFVLLWSNSSHDDDVHQNDSHEDHSHDGKRRRSIGARRSRVELISELVFELNLGLAMALLATAVLSSVFFTQYSRVWSAIYWSCHRPAWAIVTGYLVHQCATNKWRLLRRLLSLHTFAPLGRLIFLAYLVHPIFIHLHSGLVRDGLHVSLYNMLNIYISRLVMTFGLALVLHLLIELPLCSLLECLLNVWLDRRRLKRRRRRWLESGSGQPQGSQKAGTSLKKPAEPLLAIAMANDPKLMPLERQQTTETTLSQTDED